jgi:hypothetical protein
MQERKPNSPDPLRTAFLAVLLAACVAGHVAAASAQGQAATSGAALAPQPGMKVNVDPKTGRFLETPAPESASRGADSAAPLVMEPSPVPGGGTGFRVPDQRFDSEIKATTTPGGSANIACDAPRK